MNVLAVLIGKGDPEPPNGPAKHALCLTFGICQSFVCVCLEEYMCVWHATLPLIRSCSGGPALPLFLSEETEVITAARTAAASSSLTTDLTMEPSPNDSWAVKASLPVVCFSLALVVLFLSQMIRVSFRLLDVLKLCKQQTAFDYITLLHEGKVAVTVVCGTDARGMFVFITSSN